MFKRSKALALVLAVVLVFSMFVPVGLSTVGAVTTSFSDVPVGAWYYQAVTELAEKQYVSGYAGNVFKPLNTITRCEFAAMLMKGFFIENDLTVEDFPSMGIFTDVAANDWFRPYVEAASLMQVVSGTGAGKFSPKALINREQMCIMMMNFYASATLTTVAELADGVTLAFNDNASISSWALNGVKAAVDAGVMAGVSGNNFAPKGSANRAMSAQVIWKVFGILDDLMPTDEPTVEPTIAPTVEPTVAPTVEPTVEPTAPPITPTPVPAATPDSAASMNIVFKATNAGTGLWQYELSGLWGQSATAIWNNGLVPGDNVKVKFQGTGISLAGEVADYGGIIDVSILDEGGNVVSGSEMMVDMYGLGYAMPQIVYSKKDLPLGFYTLKVVKHDGKNPLNTTIYDEPALYWVDVFGSTVTPSPAPTPEPTDPPSSGSLPDAVIYPTSGTSAQITVADVTTTTEGATKIGENYYWAATDTAQVVSNLIDGVAGAGSADVFCPETKLGYVVAKLSGTTNIAQIGINYKDGATVKHMVDIRVGDSYSSFNPQVPQPNNDSNCFASSLKQAGYYNYNLSAGAYQSDTVGNYVVIFFKYNDSNLLIQDRLMNSISEIRIVDSNGDLATIDLISAYQWSNAANGEFVEVTEPVNAEILIDGTTIEGDSENYITLKSFTPIDLFDLGSVQLLDYLDIAWFQQTAQALTFDVAVSEDGVNWFNAGIQKKSTQNGGEYQKYMMTGMKARYIQFVVYGNDMNAWNRFASCCEVKVFAFPPA